MTPPKHLSKRVRWLERKLAEHGPDREAFVGNAIAHGRALADARTRGEACAFADARMADLYCEWLATIPTPSDGLLVEIDRRFDKRHELSATDRTWLWLLVAHVESHESRRKGELYDFDGRRRELFTGV